MFAVLYLAFWLRWLEQITPKAVAYTGFDYQFVPSIYLGHSIHCRKSKPGFIHAVVISVL